MRPPLSQQTVYIETDTIQQAERVYFNLKAEGTWKVLTPIKIHWSWRRFGYVASFTMKNKLTPSCPSEYMDDMILIIKSYKFQVESINKRMAADMAEILK